MTHVQSCGITGCDPVVGSKQLHHDSAHLVERTRIHARLLRMCVPFGLQISPSFEKNSGFDNSRKLLYLFNYYNENHSLRSDNAVNPKCHEIGESASIYHEITTTYEHAPRV